jgi:hypothetical protein
MSKVIAVISEDDDMLNRHVHALREKGQTARGVTARLWDDTAEPGVSAWHVVASTDAGADVLTKRIKVADEDAEIVKVVAKVKAPKADGKAPKADDTEPVA